MQSTTARRRITTALTALLLLVALAPTAALASPPTPPATPEASPSAVGNSRQARPAASFTVTARPIKGERAVATGKLGKRGKRVVLVEQKRGRTWVRVARTRSKANGRFRTTFVARRSGKVRARAPKKRRAAAYTSRARRLVLAPQTATLAVPSVVLRTQQATMTATFTPVRAGRRIELHGLVGGAWTPVATGVQDSRGQVTFTVVAVDLGDHRYRAVAHASRGAAPTASAARTMTINEFDVDISTDTRVLTEDEQTSVAQVDLADGTVEFDGPAAPHDLEVGDLLPLAPRDGAPSGALVRVVAVTDTGDGMVAQTEEADLSDVVTAMPPSEGTAVMCPVATEVTDLGDGVVVESPEQGDGACGTSQRRLARMAVAGVVDLHAAEIQLTLDARHEWEPRPGVTASAGLKGTVSAAPFVELGLETTWTGKPVGYTVGGGIEWDNSVEGYFKVTAATEKSERELDVASIKRVFGGFIGPVPVWADLSGKIVNKTGLEGAVELAFVHTRSGRDVMGVTHTSQHNLSPKHYSHSARGAATLARVTAGGKVTGGVGAVVHLSAYSIVGPYLDLGFKAAVGAKWTSDRGTTCTLEAGPYAELGLQTSDLLKKLTGGHRTGISVELYTKTIDHNLCPAGTDLGPDPDPDPDPDPPTVPVSGWELVWGTSTMMGECVLDAGVVVHDVAKVNHVRVLEYGYPVIDTAVTQPGRLVYGMTGVPRTHYRVYVNHILVKEGDLSCP